MVCFDGTRSKIILKILGSMLACASLYNQSQLVCPKFHLTLSTKCGDPVKRSAIRDPGATGFLNAFDALQRHLFEDVGLHVPGKVDPPRPPATDLEDFQTPTTWSGWWFFALALWKMMEWKSVGMIIYDYPHIMENIWKYNKFFCSGCHSAALETQLRPTVWPELQPPQPFQCLTMSYRKHWLEPPVYGVKHFQPDQTHRIHVCYIWIYMVEGSLEVKLPTIWTDEKQSRAEAERRGRLEERRSEEKE